MSRWWIWVFAGLALGVWILQSQISTATLAATTGATGELERSGQRVPAVLIASEGAGPDDAFVASSRAIPFGVAYTLMTPPGDEVQCRFRLGRITCDGGWVFRFSDPTR